MRAWLKERIVTRISPNALPFLVILAVGASYLMTIRHGHEWGDFSMYLHHAKNIAEGIPYGDTGYIYNPSFPYVGPRTYPPLLPLLLSPIYKWSGLNLTPMKVEIILFFIASLVLMCLVFRKDLPNLYLAALVAVVGFNPFFWDLKDRVISEIPFLFFTYLFLFLAHRGVEPHSTGRRQTQQGILLGVSIYLCYATRTAGIVFIPILLAYDILNSKRPTRITLTAMLSLMPLMIVQNLLLHSDYGYLDQLTTSPQIIYHHLFKYAEAFSLLWDSGYSETLGTALSVFLAGFAIVGYLGRIRRQATILEIFPLFYSASFITVTGDQGVRYLIPVIPSIVFYVFAGIMAICGPARKELERYVAFTITAAILLSYVAQYTTRDFGPIRDGIANKETVDLFDYVRRETNESDVFIFRKPRELSLYTGRKASVFHRPRNPDDLWDYFHRINATYVIVGPEKHSAERPSYLRLFVNTYRTNFQEVYSNMDFQVYKIR